MRVVTGVQPLSREAGVPRPDAEEWFRPSAGQLFRALRLRGAAAFPILVLVNIGNLVFFSRNPERAWVTASTTFAVVILAALWHGLYLLNVSITIGPTFVRWTNRFGKTNTFDRGEVVGMARRTLRVTTWGPPVPEVAVVYGHHHRCLFKLQSIYWDHEAIETLHVQLGGRQSTTPRNVTRNELSREFPGAVSRARLFGPWAALIVAAVVGSGLILIFGR